MKIITTEVLREKEIEVPVITGIYDPLSRKYDGTITPQAPVIVSGRYLDQLDMGELRLCLAPAIDYGTVIEVLRVYKFAHNQVIASLPYLPPGEYFPAVKLVRRGAEDAVYIFPVSWVVMPEGYERCDCYPCCTEIVK